MQKNVISSKQAINILIMFTLGNTLMHSGSKAEQDTWISVLIAVTMFLPMMLVYCKIVSLYPGQGLYEVIMDVFGPVFGRIIILLYCFYSVHLGAILFSDYSGFLHAAVMPETPQLFDQVLLFAFVVFMVKSGVETLGRWARVGFPIVVVSIVVTLLISAKFMQPENIEPIAATSLSKLLGSSFLIFSYPFGETVLFTMLFGWVKPDSNPYKIFGLATLFSTLILLMAFFRNILTVGFPVLDMYYYTSYTAVSIIALGEFFTRIEVLIGLAFVIDLFLKVCVCFFSASLGVAKLFGVPDFRSLIVPIGLLMIALANILYKNTLESFDWLEVYKYYALPFQVVLPLIILVGAVIKTRLRKSKSSP